MTYIPQPSPQPSALRRPQSSDDIDLQKYFFLFLGNWYWFALTIFLGLGTAYFLNRFAIKTYSVTATLLIEDEKKSSSPLGTSTTGVGDAISGFGLFPSMKNLQNQTLILQSQSQIEKAVKALDFNVSYYKSELLGTREIYYEAPFVVLPDLSKAQPLGITFIVTRLTGTTVKIVSEQTADNIKYYNFLTGKVQSGPGDLHIDKVIKFGEPVEGPGYSFTLMPRQDSVAVRSGDTKISLFHFNSYESLVREWSRKLTLSTMQKEASMVRLGIQTDCPEKAEIFLNKHLEMYLQRTLDKKNQFANNTINFIDKQLISITDSLGKKELELQNFRKANKVVDLSFQAQKLFEQTKELGNQKAELKIKQDYFTYLGEYFSKNMETADLVAPSVMGIADPLLNNLVLEINKMTDQKVAMGGDKSNNPYISTLNSQIQNTKAALRENTKNVMNNINMSIKDIDNRLASVMGEVSKLPQTERELFGIERIFKLNDFIYTYLLQRRYESQIAKASNAADNEIIDMAKTTSPFIKPKPVLNYAIGLTFGLLIPGLVLILLDSFNFKVTSEEDVKHFTDLPVAGHIIHSEREYQAVVLRDPQSNIAEAFRSLRTRLQFFTKETPSPVILVTSSMPSEGKTFSSINLASACSLSGKRTVLVGFDLRKPKIYDEFGLNNLKGVSTYLIGRDPLNEIIQASGYDNLSIISSGPIPPNPSELASSAKTKELFAELKKMFDYIIVDSAPLGAVSDTFSLAQVVDITIILVRHNKTVKNVLANTLADAKINGITNISMLMNDISRENAIYGYARRYRYGYSYGYSNGNGKIN
jgi:tyrosine-protein kinase Etk/Wzc